MLTVDNVFPLKSREVGRFFREFWLFSRENPAKSADFSANFDFFPWKIPDIACFFCEFWLFSRENPAKLADFSVNFPLKIPRNFAFFSAKYQKPCFWGLKITILMEDSSRLPQWKGCDPALIPGLPPCMAGLRERCSVPFDVICYQCLNLSPFTFNCSG